MQFYRRAQAAARDANGTVSAAARRSRYDELAALLSARSCAGQSS